MTEEKFQRILAARERMEDGLAWFRRWDSLSWTDVEEFVTACIRNPDDQRMLFLFIKDEQGKGVPTPGSTDGLKMKLQRSFRQSFETDPLSAMGAITVPHENNGFSWRVFSGHPLVANFGEGGFGRISGPPRQGKTNLGCVMIEHWLQEGNLAFANIKGLEAVEGYTYVESAKALLLAAIPAVRARRRWLWVLDEGGLVWRKDEAVYRRSHELDKFVRVIGKLRGNMLLIEQRPEAVPSTIVAWATSMFYCHRPGSISIDLRGPNLAWRQDVHDFPRTSLPFDTRDIAGFRVDINVDEMFQAVAGASDQPSAMLDYVNRPPKAPKSLGPQPRDEFGHYIPRP